MKRIIVRPEVCEWMGFIYLNKDFLRHRDYFLVVYKFDMNMPEDLLNEMPIGTHEAWRSFYRKIITRL